MSASPEEMPRPFHAGILIDGDWRLLNNRLEVRNPARPAEVVGTIGRATPSDVDSAVAAAKAAQIKWARLPPEQRAQILAEAFKGLATEIESRAMLYVRENGKTFNEAKLELQGAPGRQRLTLALAEHLNYEVSIPGNPGKTWQTRRPYGVIVSIVPWNSPISLAFAQATSALLAGNAVVLKPPETCPLTLIKSIQLIAAGLPPGLLNVVTGLPSEIGDRLTTHPDVAKVGFTGSIASARKIAGNAAGTIKSLTLELGGNDPAVVLQDAEFSDAVIDRMNNAVFRMSGQICLAIKRIYVHRSRQDEFMEKFCSSVDRIVVGEGLDRSVTMGPMHTLAAKTKAERLIGDACQRGASIRTFGKIADERVFQDGFFLRPSVLTGMSDDAPIMAEEQFCPAVPVASFDDVDEVVDRANGTIYGLGASVWGRDQEKTRQVAARLESGMVWINTHGITQLNHGAPYGGMKQSGIGRRAGVDGLFEYTQTQTFTEYDQ